MRGKFAIIKNTGVRMIRMSFPLNSSTLCAIYNVIDVKQAEDL